MILQVSVANEVLSLLPQRMLFWEAQSMLVIADLHLGKVNHFRKAGIAVPIQANAKNLEELVSGIQKTKPTRVLFLGDLFHSHYNDEWEAIGQLIKHFSGISFELVLGNHDVLSEYQYVKHGIVLHEELTINPFLFTHHPLEDFKGELYNLSGHLHPGVKLVGKGKQQLTLPCFYFGKHQGLLPAFGVFTGMALITHKKSDQVFVIVENEILKI